ncbi:MAG: sulfite reductase [Verrucomicrobia bacterium]|nr:sulfite reductase [Verrucomicrobiota bacterium]
MYTRTNPFIARIKERYLLTGPASTKRTYHIVLDVSSGPLNFNVGDSIAVLPQNDPHIVKELLHRLNLTGDETIFDSRSSTESTLKQYLLEKANLAKTNSNFIKLLQTYGASLENLLENKAELNLFLQSHSVLDILKRHFKIMLSAQELASHLMPLMPRFYSIASSPKIHPDEIHLTVAFLTYTLQGEKRHGVASHFLCDQAEIESTSIPIYVQPSNGFTLPHPDTSILLIGPGTGVAPFRAFLQERLAHNAKGRNWLFFGERHRNADFYYESFFKELEKQSLLRLDTAFSRDQAEKVYVQHKLLENAASVWDWIQTGAHLYVCGDAEKMAKDVDAALQQIVREQGGLSEEDSRLYLKRLRSEKRYLLDVY